MRPLPGAETERFLRTQPNLILGTTRRDGSPQSSPLWYLWTGDSFLMSTVPWTAKWQNLKRDPRCSVCVDDPETGRMVVAYGDAELHEGDVRERTRGIVEKYYPGDQAAADAHMERIFTSPDRRVLIEVAPNTLIARRLDQPTSA